MREGSQEGRRDRESERESESEIVRERQKRGKGLVKEQEDRTDYVLHFRTTKSDISEPHSRSFANGSARKKESGDGRTVREEPQAAFLAIPSSRFRTLEYERQVNGAWLLNKAPSVPRFENAAKERKKKATFSLGYFLESKGSTSSPSTRTSPGNDDRQQRYNQFRNTNYRGGAYILPDRLSNILINGYS